MTSAQPEGQGPPVSVERRCLNCGAALTGRYCASCSQAADVHVPSTRELIHEALEGITHWAASGTIVKRWDDGSNAWAGWRLLCNSQFMMYG